MAGIPFDSSYLGGKSITVTGDGFSGTPENNFVYICNEMATVTAATQTSLTVTLPQLPTDAAVSKYKFIKKGVMMGKPIGNEADASAPFDNKESTSYTSASDTCYVGLDLGNNFAGKLNEIHYFPNPTIGIDKFRGGIF